MMLITKFPKRYSMDGKRWRGRTYFDFPHAPSPDLAQALRHCHARDGRGEAPKLYGGANGPTTTAYGGNAPGMGCSEGDAL